MILLSETRKPVKCATWNTKLWKYERKTKFSACWLTATISTLTWLLLSRFVFHTVAVLQWHGHPRGMGIPIPKTLVIIWFLGIGMPKPRVSPYHCDNRRETRVKRRLGTRQSNPSFDNRSQEEFSRRYFALEWFYLTGEIVHHSAILQSNFIHFSFASL